MPEFYIQPVTNRQECYTCHKVVTGKQKLSKCSICHAITYCSKECQVKDFKRHNWNCVPVMVTEIPGKGRGLVASKDIKKGELVFNDKPVIEVNGASEVESLMEKIENLPSEAKLQFNLLKGFGGESLESLIAQKGNFGAIFEITVNNSRIVDDQNKAFSLYLNLALLNHSCAPNAYVGKLYEKDRNGNPNWIEIRANKDISKGEEVTFCYFGDLNRHCCSNQARKAHVKKEYGFDCHCQVCSAGLVTDQENIAMELFDHLQAFDRDHYRKGISEWARDAEQLDKFNNLNQEFQLGNLDMKCRSIISLAKTAQLARNKDLVRKGLNMMKTFADDVKMKQIGLAYEKLEKDLAQWSNNLKCKKIPKRKEIDFFLTKNIISEVKLLSNYRTVNIQVQVEQF